MPKILTWLQDMQPTDNEKVCDEDFQRALVPRFDIIDEDPELDCALAVDSFRPEPNSFVLIMDLDWLRSRPRKGLSKPDPELDSHVVILRFKQLPQLEDAFTIRSADLDLWVQDMDTHNDPYFDDDTDVDDDTDLRYLLDEDFPIGIQGVYGWMTPEMDPLIALVYEARMPAPRTTY